MESAGFGDLFARQGLKERATLEEDLGGQVRFPYAAEERALGLASLFDLKEPLPARLDHEGGLDTVCANLSARPTEKASREDLFKTLRPLDGFRFHRFQQGQFTPCHINFSKGGLVDRAHTHALAAPLASVEIGFHAR